MLREVYLPSKLAESFGHKSVEMDVDTPRMMVAGLSEMVPGFREFAETNQVAVVLTDKQFSKAEPVTQDELEFSFGDAEVVVIASDTTGAGLEVAVVGFLTSAGMSAAVATAIYTLAVNLAVSFVFSSVMKALSPQASGTAGKPAVSNPSFVFTGPANTTDQGGPFPLAYGVHEVGMTLVASEVSVEDIPYDSREIEVPDIDGDYEQEDVPRMPWQV